MPRTLHRIDVETHQAVFTWVRRRLADTGSARSNAVGIGAATRVKATSREPTNSISPSFSLTTLGGTRAQLRHEAIETVAPSRTSL